MGFFEKCKNIFFDTKEKIHTFIEDFQYKLKHLSETNYNTGMRHLVRGNLVDAMIRFKIVSKFWPDNHDAKYYLAYCLLMQGDKYNARDELGKLLKIDPQHKKGNKLLEKISNNTYSEVVNEYFAKYGKKKDTTKETK